jgi:hypothetical protein
MAKRSVTGLIALIAVVSLTGVGFAAFTSVDTVNGTATAGSANLEILSYASYGCGFFHGGAGPGTVTFSDLNAAQTAIDLAIGGLILGEFCQAVLGVENVGTGPVNLTAGVLFVGLNGICTAGEVNCFDVATLSGIAASGLTCVAGSPTPCGTAAQVSIDFASLLPGQTYTDHIAISFPPGSDASAPSTGTFELVYEATEAP